MQPARSVDQGGHENVKWACACSLIKLVIIAIETLATLTCKKIAFLQKLRRKSIESLLLMPSECIWMRPIVFILWQHDLSTVNFKCRKF